MNNSNIESTFFSKSESNFEKKLETESTEDFRRCQKTSEDTEDSESDGRETKETEKKSNGNMSLFIKIVLMITGLYQYLFIDTEHSINLQTF